ncbi:MAG TPA: response regulator transcription factor [Candidatus Ornithomonoglobus merdipullorum]|uniref:Stage 0 sporulation protein A homolog n=1 Tax=Candidatus Ornithomonoglobus merdipullorum TaxID=2840895 RepID=A0A9D1MCB6_9FIRM|nr:response regulator transcription factor [Candidatus Ornithomonoglobus merdipullorum]
MQLSVLIVDDDEEITRSTGIFLKAEGYRVLEAHDGLEALDMLMNEDIQLVLLDIMMPKLDGISTLMKLREKKNIPVIIISAKSEGADKILGLTAGADDYVTKPFDPSELVARVKSQLRRYTMLGAMEKPSESVITINGLSLDTESKTVTRDGIGIHLTPIEYKILELLMRNPNRVFSADDIYRRVWNEEAAVNDNTIAVHIRHIREKTEINPKQPQYIKVIWGIGYCIKK